MSLKSIWNSLRGRNSESDSSNQTVTATAPATATPAAPAAPSPPAAPPTTVGRSARPAKAPAKAPEVAVRPPVAIPAITPPRRSVLSMLSRGEHDALLKWVRQSRPASILEIGVGDGSRMPAILAMLQQNEIETGSFKAIVIDEFEMGGGQVTMRDYHRQLAGLTIRPVLFPEPVGRGLVNVAHRFGFIDMILIDASVDLTQAEALAAYLGKVTHAATVLLSNTSGKWTTRQEVQSARRAA